MVVVHRPHPAPLCAGNDDIADAERAALDQHGRHRAAAPVHLGLDHDAFGGAVRVGGELQQLRLEQDRLLQPVEVELLRRRNLDGEHVAAHLLGHDFVLEQVLAHAVGICVRPVDLVDGDEHRDTRRLRVIDGFCGLRHHAVVRRDHEHDDVRHARATRAHLRERGMARRVDEGDAGAPGGLHLIGADVLRDPARLARGHVAGADGVQQRRLAVIDMAHDRDHGRARDQRIFRVVLALEPDLDIGLADAPDLVAELLDHELRSVRVDRLGDGDDRAHLHQALHHLGPAHGHAAGELLHRDRLGNHDLAHDRLELVGTHRLPRQPLLALSLTAQRCEAAPALLADGAVEGFRKGDLAATPARLIAPRGAGRAALLAAAAGPAALLLRRGIAGPRRPRSTRRLGCCGFLRCGAPPAAAAAWRHLPPPACAPLPRPCGGRPLRSCAVPPRRARRPGASPRQRAGGLPPPPARAPDARRGSHPRRRAHAPLSRRSSACAGRRGSVAPWRSAPPPPLEAAALRPPARAPAPSWAAPSAWARRRRRRRGFASACASCAPRRPRRGCGHGRSSAAPGRRRRSS